MVGLLCYCKEGWDEPSQMTHRKVQPQYGGSSCTSGARHKPGVIQQPGESSIVGGTSPRAVQQPMRAMCLRVPAMLLSRTKLRLNTLRVLPPAIQLSPLIMLAQLPSTRKA